MQIHVVQRGDALWSIAQRYGVTINQIVTANQLTDPNKIVVGLALVIPTANKTHTVRSGETLWLIAQRMEQRQMQLFGRIK